MIMSNTKKPQTKDKLKQHSTFLRIVFQKIKEGALFTGK
jgi:hypothetical protein